MQSRAHATTPNGARYMTQLAKHWSHKCEVEYDARQARIALGAATLRMEARPEGLDLVIEAADEASLARLEQVVADHLARFSFREPDLTLSWSPAYFSPDTSTGAGSPPPTQR